MTSDRDASAWPFRASGPGEGRIRGLNAAIATAVKIIANQVGTRPADVGGDVRVRGEVRTRLDLLSNEVMIAETGWTGHLAALASEGLTDIHPVPSTYRRGRYLLLCDPLDGSSNIDVNAAVGTIFSVLRTPRVGAEPRVQDFLQPGVEQVCAGFASYGPATILVLTTGNGVDGFTLDRDIGAFVLTHPRMRVPEQTSEFAIDASGERFWEAPVKRYVAECLSGRTGPRQRDFTMRWVDSLVADAVRILTRGGVALYPADARRPGRLSLLFACNPIAFLMEQAGGLASTGRGRVMTAPPSELHQRAALVFGSREEVERVERYHREPSGPDRSYDVSLFNHRSLFRAAP